MLSPIFIVKIYKIHDFSRYKWQLTECHKYYSLTMSWNSLIVPVSGSHKQDITFTGVEISVYTLQLLVTWFHILLEVPFSVLLHWNLPEAPAAHPESAGLYCALFEQIKSSVTVSPRLLQRFNVISSSCTNITCIASQPEMRFSLCSSTVDGYSFLRFITRWYQGSTEGSYLWPICC